MGMYLGQLPPAEIARLKAELAETLITNFCYPRFFDPRTQTLRMRPVDRAKRQEVWLYLSSVDFTSWSRVDLMSADLQHQVERLFIMFVQRNRSFFGEQGRKRMTDIRMLINACASNVVLGLRNHVSGQKAGNPPFGSPRPVVSWNTALVTRRAEPGWEQIAAETMALQKQIQEVRGEVKPGASGDIQTSSIGSGSNGNGRRVTPGRPQMPGRSGPLEVDMPPSQSPQMRPIPGPGTVGGRPAAFVQNTRGGVPPTAPSEGLTNQRPQTPQSSPGQARKSGQLEGPEARRSGPLEGPAARRVGQPDGLTARKSGQLDVPFEAQATSEMPQARTQEKFERRSQPLTSPDAVSPPVVQSRSVAPAPLVPPSTAASSQRDSSLAMIGEDDVAIFEQLRLQLLVWMRIEAVKADLEITGQSPSQLLELLRQGAGLEETRLQVVSTLLNLANQVIKTGLVSVIDYKQALMFYLMHTKR
jgi:hypothetical protein